MKKFRIIGVIVLIAVIIISIMSPCFSMPVGALYDAFFAAWGAYCASHNMNNVFDGGDVPVTSGNSLTRNQFDTMVTDLITSWGNTTVFQNTGLTLNQWLTAASEISFAVSPDGRTTIANLADTAVEKLDSFANWVLNDVLGINRDNSGNYDPDSFPENNPISYAYGSFPFQPVGIVSSGTTAQVIQKGLLISSGSSPARYVASWRPYTFVFIVSSNGHTYLACPASNASALYINSGGNATSASSFSSSSGMYYKDITSANPGIGTYTPAPYVPVYSTLADGLAAVSAVVNGTDDNVTYNLNVLPVGDDAITVPDNTDPNYLPAPISVPLNIANPATTADGIEDINEKQRANELEKATEGDPLPDNPSAVMPPFLPSNFPNINFSLSGIWYYVTRWIASIRSGSSFMFSIWNSLPPAMFYPVYGTAVVVLVVGLYRRFFA